MANETDWGKFIIWFLTISCSIILVAIAFFLCSNIEWFKKSAFDLPVVDYNKPLHITHIDQIHLSMIKRSVGLFSVFSVLFLGLGVAFYTIKSQTTGQIQSGAITAQLTAASPGIIALLVGGYLIVATIQSKDKFPSYPSPSEQIQIINRNQEFDSKIIVPEQNP